MIKINCPACGNELLIEWTTFLSECFKEYVCHCESEICGRDWKVTVINENEIVKIEKFFFG